MSHGEISVGDVDVLVPVLAAITYGHILQHVAGDGRGILEAQIVPVAGRGERGAAVAVRVPADRIVAQRGEEDRPIRRALRDQRPGLDRPLSGYPNFTMVPGVRVSLAPGLIPSPSTTNGRPGSPSQVTSDLT